MDIVKRLRTWAEDDLRAIAHDMPTMKLPVEPADLEIWGKLMDEAADEIERLRHENAEMRRTFGSHPLFAEKDAEIGRLRDAAFNVVNHRGPGLEEWLEGLRAALRRK